MGVSKRLLSRQHRGKDKEKETEINLKLVDIMQLSWKFDIFTEQQKGFLILNVG